eukprot:1157239-Pelagomonas_calceolata.AAC.3
MRWQSGCLELPMAFQAMHFEIEKHIYTFRGLQPHALFCSSHAQSTDAHSERCWPPLHAAPQPAAPG